MLKIIPTLLRPIKKIMLTKTIKTTFLITSLFLSLHLHASDNENEDSLAIVVEYADGVNIEKHDQYLIGIGILYEEEENKFISKYNRIALTMPLSDDNNPNTTFPFFRLKLVLV